MTSDLDSIATMTRDELAGISIARQVRSPPLMAAVAARRKELDTEWLAQHAELAAAWDEAVTEDQRRHVEVTERRRTRERLLETGAPPRCVEALMGEPTRTRALEAVETFLASKSTFLLLSGSPGCGKTVAAVSALRRGACAFMRAVELARLSAFDRDDRAAFDRACTARVLVIDDLGAEMLHDGWRPALDELMDRRYGALLKTVITTNLPPTAPEGHPSFRERYGERIADRIRHDGLIELCGDKSMRRRPL